jgi:PST family polysaccharide transporter
MAMIAVMIFPLAVGLGVVALPLVALLLDEQWQGVGPMLVILAGLSVFRPLSWAMSSYLKVYRQTSILFWLELVKVGLILGSIVLLPSPLLACASIGVVFGLHAVAIAWAASGVGGLASWRLVPVLLRPLAACAVMAMAVLGMGRGLHWLGVDTTAIVLAVEIAVGALVYVPAALVLAGGASREVLGVLRKAYRRGGGAKGGPAAGQEP